MVTHINTMNEFEAFVQKNPKAIIDFFATWCGPCKMLSPVIESISAQRPKISFGKVDIDILDELATRYNVFSVPTLIFFKDGKAIADHVGYLPEEQLLPIIDAAFKD